MKILFVRHGLTEGNIANRYIGHTDEPVCARGLETLKKRGV